MSDTPKPIVTSREPAQPRSRFFYGWVIVAVAFLTLFLVVGVRFSLGVFYVAILDDYHWTRSETAVVFSIMLTVHAVFSLAVGMLFDRWGPRLLFPLGALAIGIGFAACSQIRVIWHLYVFLGLIAALGIAMLAFVPHMALVSAWFDRRRGTATGIAYAGIGGGQLALAPCIQLLINWLDWRGAFLVLALVIVAVVVPLTAIFHRRAPQELGLEPDGLPRRENPKSSQHSTTNAPRSTSSEWSITDAIRTPQFWYLIVTVLGMGVMLNTMMVHQMAYLTDVGYSKMLGATWLGIVGGLRAVGGMTMGPLSDRLGRERAYTLGTLCCCLGLLMLLSIQDTAQPWRLYAFALLFGIGQGSLGPIYASATADLFPGRSLGTILGCLEAAYGLGGACGTFLAGYLYDTVGNYRASFVAVILVTALSSLALWLAAPRRCRAA